MSAASDMAEAIREMNGMMDGVRAHTRAALNAPRAPVGLTGRRLVVRAIDGGAALSVEDGGGTFEIRMGWHAACEISSWIGQAMAVSPPWVLSRDREAVWTDQGLEVFSQSVSLLEGDGATAEDQIFVRLAGSPPLVAAEADGPAAVFASHDKPHGRPPFGLGGGQGRDGDGFAADQASELQDSWQYRKIGATAQIVVAPASWVVENDGPASVPNEGGIAHEDGGDAGPPRAAGRGPVDADVGGPAAGEGEAGHQGAPVGVLLTREANP